MRISQNLLRQRPRPQKWQQRSLLHLSYRRPGLQDALPNRTSSHPARSRVQAARASVLVDFHPTTSLVR